MNLIDGASMFQLGIAANAIAVAVTPTYLDHRTRAITTILHAVRPDVELIAVKSSEYAAARSIWSDTPGSSILAAMWAFCVIIPAIVIFSGFLYLFHGAINKDAQLTDERFLLYSVSAIFIGPGLSYFFSPIAGMISRAYLKFDQGPLTKVAFDLRVSRIESEKQIYEIRLRHLLDDSEAYKRRVQSWLRPDVAIRNYFRQRAVDKIIREALKSQRDDDLPRPPPE